MATEPKRIVVASQDSALCAALEAQLSARGYQVSCTDNGFKATQLVDSETLAGLVVAVKLTGQSGLQVAATAKAHKANSRAPIVVIAEAADDGVVKRVAQLGIAQLVVAPATPEDVIKGLKLDQSTQKKAASTEGYDVRIINAFTDALGETLEFYFGQRPPLGKAGIKTNDDALGYLSSLISFTGDTVKGSMAMSFEEAFLHALGRKVFADQAVEMNDTLVADMAGEMANQVCGAVKLKLSKLGLKVQIGLPKVVIGKQHRLLHIVKNPVIWMPVVLAPDAKASIEFCMTKNDEPIVEPEETDDMKGGDVLLF